MKQKNYKIAIHCQTQKDAEELLKFLHGLGYTWRDGNTLVSYNNWEIYEEKTYYLIDKNTVGFGNDYYDCECVIEFSNLKILKTLLGLFKPKIEWGFMAKNLNNPNEEKFFYTEKKQENGAKKKLYSPIKITHILMFAE